MSCTYPPRGSCVDRELPSDPPSSPVSASSAVAIERFLSFFFFLRASVCTRDNIRGFMHIGVYGVFQQYNGTFAKSMTSIVCMC